MGLFDSIGKAIINTVVAPAANTITKGIEYVTGKKYGRTSVETYEKSAIGRAAITTLGGVAAATGVAAAAPIVARAAPSIAKALVPTTAKGAIIGGTAALVGVPAVIQNPKIVTSTASGLVNVGSNIGKASKEPSISSITNIVKENPIISTGIIAAGAAPLIPAAVGAIGSSRTTSAIKEQTEILQKAAPAVAAPVPITKEIVVTDSGATVKDLTPTPAPQVQPQEVTTTGDLAPAPAGIEPKGVSPPKRKKKKNRPKPQPMKISQRVSVNVSQKNVRRKNYINLIYT